MYSTLKTTLIILFFGIVVISIILIKPSIENITILENSEGKVTSIQIWNIALVITQNKYVFPFVLIPFIGLFYSIRYLIKSTILRIKVSSHRNSVLETATYEEYNRQNSFMAIKKPDVIAAICFIIIAPISVFLIYYYPYKSVYSLSNAGSDEFSVHSYYFFPKKEQTQNFHLSSNDSLLIHLWAPSAGGNDEQLPAGQVFLYYTKTSQKKTATGADDRAELFTGSRESAERFGMFLHQLTGLKTVVNHMEGFATTPVSQKVFPCKLIDQK